MRRPGWRPAAAAAAYLPWLTGLRNDLSSPTTDILSALQPFDPYHVGLTALHWSVGYPYATVGMAEVPGVAGLAMLRRGAAGGRRAAPSSGARRPRRGPVRSTTTTGWRWWWRSRWRPRLGGVRHQPRGHQPVQHPQPGGVVAGAGAWPCPHCWWPRAACGGWRPRSPRAWRRLGVGALALRDDTTAPRLRAGGGASSNRHAPAGRRGDRRDSRAQPRAAEPRRSVHRPAAHA